MGLIREGQKRKTSSLCSGNNITLSILDKYLHPGTRWSPNLDKEHLLLLGFAGNYSMYSVRVWIKHAFLIDRIKQSFYTLKICVCGQAPDQEIAISTQLKNTNDHFGGKLAGLVLNSFGLIGPHGKHVCLAYESLGMNFTEFQNLPLDSKFPKDLVQRDTQLTLIALAFIHENNVIHTGKSTNKLKNQQQLTNL